MNRFVDGYMIFWPGWRLIMSSHEIMGDLTPVDANVLINKNTCKCLAMLLILVDNSDICLSSAEASPSASGSNSAASAVAKGAPSGWVISLISLSRWATSILTCTRNLFWQITEKQCWNVTQYRNIFSQLRSYPYKISWLPNIHCARSVSDYYFVAGRPYSTSTEAWPFGDFLGTATSLEGKNSRHQMFYT